MDKYFGARLGYILTVYLVLCATLGQDGINIGVIFGTIVLFVLPFVFEYYNMVAVTNWGKKLRGIGFWCSLFAFSVIGASMLYTLFRNLDHTVEQRSVYVLFFSVPVSVFQYVCGFWLLLGFIDWLVYSNKEEQAVRKEIRDNQRQESQISFNDRVNHYNGHTVEK